MHWFVWVRNHSLEIQRCSEASGGTSRCHQRLDGSDAGPGVSTTGQRSLQGLCDESMRCPERVGTDPAWTKEAQENGDGEEGNATAPARLWTWAP